jgi:hypothetical protein
MNDSQPIDNLDSIAIILLSREFERFARKKDQDQVIAEAYAWANQVMEERSKYIDVPLSADCEGWIDWRSREILNFVRLRGRTRVHRNA